MNNTNNNEEIIYAYTKQEHCEYLDAMRGVELTYAHLHKCLDIWRQSHSSTTTLFAPSRWGNTDHMPATLIQILTLLDDFNAAGDDVISDGFTISLANIIDYRDSSHSSSAKSTNSSTNQIIRAILSTTTMQQYYFGQAVLTEENKAFLQSLQNQQITYGQLKRCASIKAEKEKVFTNVALQEMSHTTSADDALQEVIGSIPEDADDDTIINAGVRGKLLETLKDNPSRPGADKLASPVVSALLETTSLYSSVTVNQHTSLKVLVNWLDTIRRGVNDHELNSYKKTNINANLAVMKRIITNLKSISQKPKRCIYINYGIFNSIPVHLENYRSNEEAYAGLHRLILSVIQYYQQAEGYGQLDIYYKKFGAGGACIEARTHALREWAGQHLSDNKAIAEAAVLSFDELLEAHVAKIPNPEHASQLDVMFYLWRQVGGRECHQNHNYAPDNVVTMTGLQKYSNDILCYDDKPSYDALIARAHQYVKDKNPYDNVSQCAENIWQLLGEVSYSAGRIPAYYGMDDFMHPRFKLQLMQHLRNHPIQEAEPDQAAGPNFML